MVNQGESPEAVPGSCHGYEEKRLNTVWQFKKSVSSSKMRADRKNTTHVKMFPATEVQLKGESFGAVKISGVEHLTRIVTCVSC